jgi:flagellar basal-body rod protein FlgF
MNYGLMISASGALTSLHRQQVLTNNLANVNTAGFKPSFASVRQRDVARIEDGVMSLPSNAMLEKLGAGVMLMPTQTSMKQGSLEETGRPFDLALEGKGFFVLAQQGENGQENIRFTRDGQLTRNSEGRLVHAATGLEVLDEDDRAIDVPGRGAFMVDSEGWISAGAQRIAKIQIAELPDPGQLKKLGANLFGADPVVMTRRRAADATIQQRFVEQSGVNEISAMMAVTGASKAFSSNIGMITYHDKMMDRAINALGRVT